MNRNFAFIISDIIYMMKNNNTISALKVHRHCSKLYEKYALKGIHIRTSSEIKYKTKYLTEPKQNIFV